jgi:TrmH family RNA methyltransferase
MASLGRVKIHYGNLPQMILACDLPLFAAVMDGTPGRNITFPQNMLLVIGNEGQGISEEILNLKHQGITIEKYGEAESLNAAMAGAILLDRYFGQFA